MMFGFGITRISRHRWFVSFVSRRGPGDRGRARRRTRVPRTAR